LNQTQLVQRISNSGFCKSIKQELYAKCVNNLRELHVRLGGHLLFYDSSVRWLTQGGKVGVAARVFDGRVLYCLETSHRTLPLSHFHADEVTAKVKELLSELH